MHWTKGLCGLVALVVVGCSPLSMQPFSMASFGFRSGDSAEKDLDDEDGEFSTKVNTPLIGEYTQIGGLNVIVLQGVGLVTGLQGTGGDPAPSIYRTAMLEDMRKRNIKNPNELLRDPNTALVVVRAYLPPLIAKGEHFDVEVRAADGTSVQSLNGGWLMETSLSEQALVPGQGVLQGHIYAKAQGPVLVSMEGKGGKEGSPLLQQGRIVGGGISKKDRDLTLFLRNDFRSVRNSDRIAKRIGERFFEYNDSGQRKPLAEAKTDQQIELKVQSKYKDNFPRYLQVIRSISYRETAVAQQVRLRDLKDKLLTPETAEEASIKLEAIGDNAVPVLKAGLQSPSREVRFHSAMALAYMGKPDGLKELADAVRDEPAFRVFGLAAMAVVEDAESYVRLKELLSSESAETRYGAFRALSTLYEDHPDVRGEKMGDEFRLHVLHTTGTPLVHLANRRKAEVVLFGADQRFRTPLVAYAGLHILATAQPGSEKVTVSRFEPGRRQDQVRTVSTRIDEVIRAAVELGATYPDIAELLSQAGAMQNLPGRIEIDALPKAGRVYIRPENEVAGKTKSRAHVGNSSLVPNLFSSFDDSSDSPEKETTPEAKQSTNDSDSKKQSATTESMKNESALKTGQEKPEKETAGASTKKEMKPAEETRPLGAGLSNDDDDEFASENSSGGWGWNRFRMFRGIGQSEPDLNTEPVMSKSASSSTATATEKKTAMEKNVKTGESPVGEQSEP